LHSMKRICLLIGFLVVAVENPAIAARVAGVEPDALKYSTQLIVVTTANWNEVGGQLQRYERGAAHKRWRKTGAPISIVVGKNGLGWGIGIIATDAPGIRRATDPIKKEGDGRGPAGVFTLGTAFGYAQQPLPGLKLPYLNLTPTIECVDDIGSKYYNRIVDHSTVAPDWNSSEHMRSVGEAYRWGVVVGHNRGVTQGDASRPIPGGGSCVFLHIWSNSGQGTAGCTAMPQDELETLLKWLDPARKPLLVQLPAPEYSRLRELWRLPPLAGD
jgi:D-alanyl-D-alanine dipeptidase